MTPDASDPPVEIVPLGRERLRPRRRADRDGLACYLTTARRENLRFYRRLGFQVEHDALQLAPDGPTSWGMRRPPRT